MQSLAQKLERARQQRFVGRQAEMELWRSALAAEMPPFTVLHFYGPGGVGKTTLLYELAQVAVAAGRMVIQLDGRYLEANAAAVEVAVDLDGAEHGSIALLIDTYELIASLDGWLRAVFLPQLPADTLIVIAGRMLPVAWRRDNGWAELTRVVALGNLTPDEGRIYLAAHGVPADQHDALLGMTHGHPLALSLVAELYQQNAAATLAAGIDAPDVIQVLVERFVQDAPTSDHRTALELCVIARTTTESLLAERFAPDTAYELFQWLRRLSFVETGPFGLLPHDLVRDVLDADLHWRNPTAYAELQQVALAYLRKMVQQATGVELQRLRVDIIYVNRRAPWMRDYFVWDAADVAYAEPAQPADHPAILEMVSRYEGSASAAIAAHWLARQPEAFLAYRTSDGALYGFMAQLALHKATAADAAIDPAVTPALEYIAEHHPLQSGDVISYVRFWMAAATYQAISYAVNLTAANCIIHWTSTPHLVWSFVTMSNPDFMAPHFESIHFPRTREADFTVGERQYGIFSHNWTVESVQAWQVATKHADEENFSDTLLSTASSLHAEPAPIPALAIVALSEEEFLGAVRQALRDYTRPDMLVDNPLLHTSLLPPDEQTPAALQALLCATVADFNQHPKDAKLYRALWHTYIDPAPTQEQAAEMLDLPFNTYRYHLASGLTRLVAALWRRTQD